MQIASVEAVPVTVSLAKPVVMSHITVERSHNVLAKVTTDDGIVGWGEGVEATDLTGDTQEAIRAAIEFSKHHVNEQITSLLSKDEGIGAGSSGGAVLGSSSAQAVSPKAPTVTTRSVVQIQCLMSLLSASAH